MYMVKYGMPQSFDDIINSVNHGLDAQFRIAVRNRKNIYNDCWEYIIREELKDQFTQKSLDKLKCLVTGELNVFKRTINTISTIYKDTASRKAILPEGLEGVEDVEDVDVSQLKTDPVYDKIIKKFPFDLMMQKANQMTNATNACAVRSVYRDGKMDYDVITFDNLQILFDPEDWKKIIAYQFYIGESPLFEQPAAEITNDQIKADPHRDRFNRRAPRATFERAILYTSDSEVFPERLRGKIIHYKQNAGADAIIDVDEAGNQRIEDNPYKDAEGKTVMPFTLILKEYPVDRLIDYTSGNDLVYLAINSAINYIHMNSLIKYQSWKQGYIISDLDMPGNMLMDPAEWIKVPASKNGGTTDVGLLDLQASIKDQWEVIVERIALGVAQYGIDVESLVRKGGSPESGFSLEIRKEGLREIREAQIPIYRAAEKDLFEKTRIVYNFHNPDAPINPESKFFIDFGESTGSINQAERDQHWLTVIRENVNNVLNWAKEENPDLQTDKEAELFVKKNRSINANFPVSVRPVEQPIGAEEETEDESEAV